MDYRKPLNIIKQFYEKPLVLKVEDIDEINQYVKEYQGYCLELFKTKFNNGLII